SFFRPRSLSRPVESSVRLQGSADWEELWEAMRPLAIRLRLKLLRLDVNAPAVREGYHAQWGWLDDDEKVRQTIWRAAVPLCAGGQPIATIELAGERNGEPVWSQIAEAAEFFEEFEATATALLAKAALGPAHMEPVDAVLALEGNSP